MKFKIWLENEVQEWLSGSVIQNIVYHGTDKKFNQFDYQSSQRFILFSSFNVQTKGFFFAENPHDALEYGNNVVACYINLKNPFFDPRRDKSSRLDYRKEIQLMKILAPLIEKDPKNGPYIDIGTRRVYLKDRSYSFAHQWIYEAIGNEGVDWDVLDNAEVVKRMMSFGYDGTFVQEPQSHSGRSIFVPNINQIRIAQWYTGAQKQWGNKDDYYKDFKTNNITFSPSNPEGENVDDDY